MNRESRHTLPLPRAMRRLRVLAPILALLLVSSSAPLSAARPADPLLSCPPVTGTFIDVHGATGTFDGCFAGRQLVLTSSQLGLAGDLSLVLRDHPGRGFARLEETAILPVHRLATAPGALHLALAPSRVIVAGLQAYVDPVELDLAAWTQEASPASGALPQVALDYATAWSSGDPDQVVALYADDALFEEVVLGGAVTHSRDELRDYVAAVYAAFPDFTAVPSGAFAADNIVVIEWVLSGTYQGQFGSLPAGTGQSVEVRIATVLELGDDGLILRDSEYWDLATLLTQVGAMPGAAATPAAQASGQELL